MKGGGINIAILDVEGTRITKDRGIFCVEKSHTKWPLWSCQWTVEPTIGAAKDGFRWHMIWHRQAREKVSPDKLPCSYLLHLPPSTRPSSVSLRRMKNIEAEIRGLVCHN